MLLEYVVVQAFLLVNAIVLDILIFPEGDPDFISYIYIYAIREDVYVFALYEEIKNLEVFELWSPEGIAVYMPATRSRERSGYSVIAHKDGGVKIRTQ